MSVQAFTDPVNQTQYIGLSVLNTSARKYLTVVGSQILA
jgi:hypothetical protein